MSRLARRGDREKAPQVPSPHGCSFLPGPPLGSGAAPAPGQPSAFRSSDEESVTPPTRAPAGAAAPSPPAGNGGPSGSGAAVGAAAGSQRDGVAGGSGSSAATTSGAVREATPLALAGLVANAANVLVTLVIARALTTRGYGTLAQLIAIFFVVSMPGSALLVGIVQRVTHWQAVGRSHLVPAWTRRVRRVAFGITAATFVAALLVAAPLADALSVPSRPGLVAVLTAGAAWGLLSIDRGLLQASRAYNGLAANLLAEAGLRSGLTVVFVVAGLGAAGAAAAMLAGIAGADLHARWVYSRHQQRAIGGAADRGVDAAEPPAVAIDPGPAVPPAVALPPATSAGGRGPRPARRLRADVGLALATLGLLGLLQNIDVVVLGRARPDAAGTYAAVSVASKALVFAALVLSSFLLPEAATRRAAGQHALRQLSGTLAVLAVPCGLLFVLAAAAPETLLRTAFGPRYVSASGALLPLALAMTCLGATVLFVHYLLGAGHRRAVLALGVAVVVAIPALAAAHGAPTRTAVTDLAVQAVLAAVTGALVLQAALALRRSA